MKDEKLYAERDHRALKPRYSGDISAMTAEDLREKGDILDKLVRREEGGDDMSKLREAARAVVDQWDTPNWNLDMHTGVLIDRLRAALAQPETAEPVAWMNRYGATMKTRDRVTANAMGFTTPLYASPPCDEWRPASEPPEDLRRRVIAWRSPPQRQSGTWVEALYDDGAWVTRDGIAHDITHWRDVTPPTGGSK